MAEEADRILHLAAPSHQREEDEEGRNHSDQRAGPTDMVSSGLVLMTRRRPEKAMSWHSEHMQLQNMP